MKRCLVVIMALCLLWSGSRGGWPLPPTAFAAQKAGDWRADDHSITLFLYGHQVSGGVAPQLVQGTVMVPIHNVAVLMGWDCEWNAEDRVFTLYKNGVTVDIPAGGSAITRTYRDAKMLIPVSLSPKHYGEEMLIPLETVYACLRLDARWNPDDKRVSLGAWEEQVQGEGEWKRLRGHEYEGMYDILFLMEGTGNYLRYQTEISPVRDGGMQESFTFTDLDGVQRTQTRERWYQYFRGLSAEQLDLTTLYRQFGDFYIKWREFYRDPSPERVAQDFIEQMYGPIDEEDSSWCLRAFFEVDGGYYTGFNDDIADEED